MDPRQIDDYRTLAIQMMDSHHGRAAIEGGYYTRLFNWLFHELERGRTPAGIPAKLLEAWRGRSGA